MQYPEIFVHAVKAAYPDWERMHRKLDEGSEFVGRYLDDSRVLFTPDDILKASSLEELQTEARQAQTREQLYIAWCELYKQQKWPYGGFEGVADEE